MGIELVARQRIGRRALVKKAQGPGEKDVHRRDDVAAGNRFEVETEEEAKALTSGERPAARRVSAEEKARPRLKAGDLEKMSRAELETIAAERGIDTGRLRTKDDFVAALKKHG